MTDLFAHKTLLVVEDEPDLREPLAENFTYLGLKVLQAANAPEALAHAEATHVDVVVSDIRMPGGDGIELLRRLRAMPAHHPASMLMTGYAEFSPEVAYGLGAQAIVAKPFDLDHMDQVVERLLTPLQDRFAPHPGANPGQEMLTLQFASLQRAADAKALALGRGGVSFTCAQVLRQLGQKVAFKINFAGGEVAALHGVGVLRWVRPHPTLDGQSCCGMEFEQLTDSCRDPFLGWVHRHGPRSFIPSGPAGHAGLF